eukprot:scaffold104660_cov60-Phaeocystis_antarctica.AAC.4
MRYCGDSDDRQSYILASRKAARRRHSSAREEYSAFPMGASHNAAARSKCVAAFLSSAREQGPAAPPRSASARMTWDPSSFGIAFKTLADITLRPLLVHHSGLTTSAHSSCRSISKADAVTTAQSSDPSVKRSLASRNRRAASTLSPELPSAAPRL